MEDLSTEQIIAERIHLKLERTGAHSHIHGLGLGPGLVPKDNADGLVGQIKARKAAGLVVNMIKEGKLSGRAILMAGPSGTGKTAIAVGISKALSPQIPFVSMSASEVYSLGMSKTEALMQAFRKAINAVILEEREILEGEVIEFQMERSSENLNAPRVGKLTMKTTAMETVFDVGQKMIDQLMKEKISAGDIITIDKSTGTITKLGRNFTRSSDFDASGPALKFVQCPDGEIQKRNKVSHCVSLHEIDVINSRQDGFMALFSGDTGEIKSEIREKVNGRLAEWREEGKTNILPGVLFIDEAHMLDIECFSFLNRALESEWSPILILATNRGITKIRGTNYESPHGIPIDFLDRTIIIQTTEYSMNEIGTILALRAEEEDVKLDQSSITLLTTLATQTSLRYGLQLIITAQILAKKRKASIVEKKDIVEAYGMFIDRFRSQSFIDANQESFIFNSGKNAAPSSVAKKTAEEKMDTC